MGYKFTPSNSVLAYENLLDKWRECRNRVDSYEKGNGRNNPAMVNNARDVLYAASDSLGELVDALKARNSTNIDTALSNAHYAINRLIRTVKRWAIVSANSKRSTV